MKHNYDFTDYDEVVTRQTNWSKLICSVLLIILIAVLTCINKMSQFTILQNEPETNYDMLVTIDNIGRIDNYFYLKVSGVHDNNKEEHVIEITKDEFMKYKEGQMLSIRVGGQHCYILSVSQDGN